MMTRFNPSRIRILVLLCLFHLALFSFLAYSAVITIPGDYLTVRTAIDAATEGDELPVFISGSAENINLGGKNALLRPTEPWNKTSLADTFLSERASRVPSAEESAESAQLLARTPPLFVENKGQWTDGSFQFALRTLGANILITDNGPVIQLVNRKDELIKATIIKARFIGSNKVSPEGIERDEWVINYFCGPREQWESNVPTYGAVAYRELYEGIDLYLRGRRDGLKLEFHLRPEADWRKIALAYEGMSSLAIDSAGRLVISTAAGDIVDQAPVIYQEIGGQRAAVQGRFRLIDRNTFGFEVTGSYNPSYSLVIDPDLVWSTYLGGINDDSAEDIAVDASGNVYVTGWTNSSNFPTTNGWDTSFNGGPEDCFVSKFSTDGSQLLWSTYLGGNGVDRGFDIAVDDSGCVYVTVMTFSSDFPTTNAWDTTYGGNGDGVVAKLSQDGQQLLWSTYLGGSLNDVGKSIAIDDSGSVHVTGDTESSNFPTINAWDTSRNGPSDGFVSKFSSDGQQLLWSTYLGGSDYEYNYGIAVDGAGNVYVTGYTESSDFPTTNAWDTTYGGNGDVVVAKLSQDGQQLLWSTFLGGSGYDYGKAVAVDGSAYVYVTGITYSGDFPTPNGWDTSHNSYSEGYGDAFVLNLSPNGQQLLWSTYLGGINNDYAEDIAVDETGHVCVTGATHSSNFPTPNGWDTSFNGPTNVTDCFVSRFSADGQQLLWSTFLGGISGDYALGVAVDGAGDVWVTGFTYSSDFPTLNGWDMSYNGYSDVFVSNFSAAGTPTPTETPLPGVKDWDLYLY